MKASKRIRRAARQLFRLSHTDGLFDESRGQHLLQRFLRAKPRGCLQVLIELKRLLKRERAQRSATVESAMTLSAEDTTHVRTRLEQVYGQGLNISFSQNPGLIGGMRVTVGSDVYDGSVQGRLLALQQRFS